MKRSLLIIFLFLFISLEAQKEAYNWYFGEYAGITFHNKPPTALSNGKVYSNEGCASMSTKEGRLLLYTNGLTIWDSTHNAMPNGQNLPSNHSASQSSVIVPDPADKHRFYVFIVDYDLGTNGITYNHVDMRLNNGRGDVISGKKSIKLMNQFPTCEKICAVQHSNERFYWIVTPSFGTDSVRAYLVDSNGVNPQPVLSSTGMLLSSPNYHAKIGYIKASPEGNRICYANTQFDSLVIADFDPFTGMVSNAIAIHLEHCYGVDFSACGDFVYVTQPTFQRVSQYDARAANRNDFIKSRITVDTFVSGGFFPYGMQLGPDGKIYINYIYNSVNRLSVIHAPDSLGKKCRPQHAAIPLVTNNSRLGLPGFPNKMLRPFQIIDQGRCASDTFFFDISQKEKLDSVLWDFGDPSSGALNVSDEFVRPYHIYKKGGEYKVKLTAYRKNVPFVRTQFIQVYEAIKPQLGRDTLFCNAFSYKLKIKNHRYFDSFTWQNNSHGDSLLINSAGTYSVMAIDTNACPGRDTILIRNPKLKALINARDTQLCQGPAYFFRFADSTQVLNEKVQSRGWQFSDGHKSSDSVLFRNIQISGVYKVKLKVLGQSGCRDSVEMQFKVRKNPKAGYDVLSDTVCLPSTTFFFRADSLAYKTYIYDYGDGNSSNDNAIKSHTYSVSQEMSFTTSLFVTDSFGCRDSVYIPIYILRPKSRFMVNKVVDCIDGNGFSLSASNVPHGVVWELHNSQKKYDNPLKIKYPFPGTYKVRVSAYDSNHCMNYDSFELKTVWPDADMVINDTQQCLGDNLFSFDSKTFGKQYQWSFGDNQSDTLKAVRHRYQKAGFYTVVLKVEDSFGCEAQDTAQLRVLDQPLADFEIVTEECSAEVLFRDKSSFAHDLNWHIDTGTYKGSPLKMTFSKPGLYKISLQVADNTGNCRDTAEQTLDLSKLSTKGILKIPNVFTPNNDGFNDCYTLGGLDGNCGDIGSISIFDRWGVEVYKGELPAACWNGRLYNTANDLPSGTYMYIIELTYKDINGNLQKLSTSGVIHLLR